MADKEPTIDQGAISLATPVRLLRKMNHDLRNPLNVVLATSSMLADGGYDPLTPRQERAVQRIERNSRRMLFLLDDLIAYTTAEAGEYLLIPDLFDPRALLTGVGDLCRPTAEAKGLTLTLRHTDSMPARLHGDASVVERVVQALVWNAISFSSRGAIDLSSEWSAGGEWLIAVKDRGPAIPPEVMQRIFAPFWQGATKGASVPTSGFGLGLAMGRALARLMQGEILLQQSGSTGKVFVLRLPLKPGQSEQGQ